jgi:hypothetical protein
MVEAENEPIVGRTQGRSAELKWSVSVEKRGEGSAKRMSEERRGKEEERGRGQRQNGGILSAP